MLEKLRETCRSLLAGGEVQVVLGYAQPSPGAAVVPAIITRAEDCDTLVWNDRCEANLTAYLKRKEINALGKAAVVVKGCDARTLVVLEKESQIDRSQVVVIGMACGGVGSPLSPKCATCDARTPQGCDLVIGEPPTAASGDQRYADVDAFLKLSPQERMAYWTEELSRCVKCYACRQACPLCYCQRCIVDKNRPQAIDTSATLKGNFAWHIARAFHLAGRCVGCDACVRACPAGIDLRLLNLSLAKAAEDNFGFRAGADPAAEPIIGAYSLQDKEAFIR